MAPTKRKRSRPNRADDTTQPPNKRKNIPEDEDILSDDVDGGSDREMPPSPIQSEGEEEEEIPENETAEEKRLRLARAYLRHIGVSEEAALENDKQIQEHKSSNALNIEDLEREEHENEGDIEEEDIENKRLREEVLAESGKGVIRLADELKTKFHSITVNKGYGNKKEGLTHRLSPTCLSISRNDNSTAASSGKDSRIIIWDIGTNKSINVFKPDDLNGKPKSLIKDASNIRKGHIGIINTVKISDDGNIIASGGMDKLIRLWDKRSNQLITSLKGHRNSVNSLALRIGSRQLFSASSDRTIKIWDLAQMSYIETLFGHGADVNHIDTMISEKAISSGRDGTIRLYKIAESSQLLFRNSSTMSIDTVSVMNEQRFISGGDDGSICLWHLNKKRPTATAPWAHGKGLGVENWISSVCALRNSDVAVSGAGDGKVRFWKCEDKPKLVEIDSVDVGPGFVNALAVGKRRNVLGVAVGDEHRLGRWSRIRQAKNSVQFMSLPLEEGE